MCEAYTCGTSGALHASQKPLQLLYGSQTGTAEGFAKQLEGEARAHGFSASCIDLEHFTPDMLTAGGMGVYLMATYGEGDPTDNAVEFTKWLTDGTAGKEAEAPAKGYSFTVFGLGNRQYEHYNAMGKIVDSRLEALGGTRVYQHGEGDDDGSLDDDWEEWKADLWAALQAAAGAASAGGEADKDGLPAMPELKFELVSLGDERPEGADDHVVPHALTPAELRAVDKSSRPFFEAKQVPVVANRQLRQAPGQGDGTVHVSLDLSGTTLTYGTADNLGVLPVNSTSSVLELANWCDWHAQQWIDLKPAKAGTPPLFPMPCTVAHALGHYCDLHGPLSKSLVAAMAHFATRDAERSRLAHLVSRAAKEEYAETISKPQMSVVELLQEFPSIKPPLGAFLELVPRLQPRLYTIASSALVQPTQVDIAVSVIDRPKPSKAGVAAHPRRLTGVASAFIACSGQGSEEEAALPAMQLSRKRYLGVPLEGLRVVVRPSTFNLPPSPATPVILVGPGTGLAPMRAFLQERAAQRSAGEEVGPTLLFFGCRREEEDFIYKEELQGWLADGTLTALYTAFSRQQEHKVYVQHRIAEHGAQVWELLSQGAHVYVCGATNMGTDVAGAVKKVAMAHGDMPPDQVQAWFDGLHKAGRYVSELWSA